MKGLWTAALVAIALVSQPSYSENPVRIGLLTDLSGQAAYWGLQSRLGAEMLQEDLQAKGKKLQIVYEDHGLSPKDSVSATQKLILVDKVDAIYSEFTVTTIAASPIAKTNKTLFLGLCAADSFLERNPYSVKSYINYVAACKSLAAYWKSIGLEKVAVLKASTEYGEHCEEGIKKLYPNAEVVDYSYGQEVSAQALLIKRSGAEAVANASFEGDVLNMVESFQKLSYYPHIGANFDAITDKVRERYPQHRDKFVSFGFRQVSEDFIARAKAKDPSNSLISIEAAALSYLHLQQMYEAVLNCPRTDSECQIRQLAGAQEDSEEVIGFQRFRDRQAVFALGLKISRNGQDEWIEAKYL